MREGHNHATSILNAERILAIVPHRYQNPITAVLQKVLRPVHEVFSDFAPAMATAIHALDCFHLVQFFTDAQQRRRRYIGEAKKHHKSRFIDRCLARIIKLNSLKDVVLAIEMKSIYSFVYVWKQVADFVTHDFW